MGTTRREVLSGVAAALAGIAGAAALAHATGGAPRVVRITARKFEFAPRIVALARGEAVVLELEALDRDHGFDCPALGLKADLAPGRPVRLPIRPDQAGRFEFVCNTFCGEGHDEMDGEIVVTA